MTLTDHPTGENPGSGRRPWPRIAAVIPALDEAQSIARVVEGLRAQALLASGEIIVVDNGSTDGTGEIARRAGSRVVREERRGYGYACLAGVLALMECPKSVRFVEKSMFFGSHRELGHRAVLLDDAQLIVLGCAFQPPHPTS